VNVPEITEILKAEGLIDETKMEEMLNQRGQNPI
jgi:hypothetical protein